MQINVTYDQVATAVPAGFREAVSYVANLFGDIFTNNTSINISVGFGEINGIAMSEGAVGSSKSNSSLAIVADYGTVRQVLNTSGEFQMHLPPADPFLGKQIVIGSAEARAIGLLPSAPHSGIDGYVGFSATEIMDYNITQQTSNQAYNFVSVVEHEFSEIMGRASRNFTFNSAVSPGVLDLFRFAKPDFLTPVGSLAFGTTKDSYFSTNGGATSLLDFNNSATSGGDDADWADGSGNDAFLARSLLGVKTGLSGTDLSLMRALGWQTNVIGTGTNVTGNGETDLFTKDSSGNLSATLVNSSGNVTGSVQLGSGPLVVNASSGGAIVNLDHATVTVATGSVATVNGLSNTVSIAAAQGTIAAAAFVNGASSTVSIGTGSSAVVNGDSAHVTLATSSVVVVNGASNTVTGTVGDDLNHPLISLMGTIR